MKDDLIRRGELAEEVKSLTFYVTGLRAGKGVLQEYAKQYRDSLLRIIDEQPAVDAVEVVRCEDCKHSRERNKDEQRYLVDGVLICTSPDATDDCWNPVWPVSYCRYGERREDDG